MKILRKVHGKWEEIRRRQRRVATGAGTKTVYVGLISALGLFVPVVKGEVRRQWAISDASKSSLWT